MITQGLVSLAIFLSFSISPAGARNITLENANYRVNVEETELNSKPTARLKIYNQKVKKSSHWIELAATPETMILSERHAFVLCMTRTFKGKIYCINLAKHEIDKVIEPDIGPRLVKLTPFSLLVLNTISATLMRISLEDLSIAYESCPFSGPTNPFLSSNIIAEIKEDAPKAVTFYARDSQIKMGDKTFPYGIQFVGTFDDQLCLIENTKRESSNPTSLHFVNGSNIHDIKHIALPSAYDTWFQNGAFLYLGDSKSQHFCIYNLKTQSIVLDTHVDFPPLCIFKTGNHVVITDRKTLEYYEIEDHAYTHQLELGKTYAQFWLSDAYLFGVEKEGDKVLSLIDLKTLKAVATINMPSAIKKVLIKDQFVYVFTTSGQTLIINIKMQKELFTTTLRFPDSQLYFTDKYVFAIPGNKFYIGQIIPCLPSINEVIADPKRIVDLLTYDPNLFKVSTSNLEWDAGISSLMGDALWKEFVQQASDQKKGSIKSVAQKLLAEKNPIVCGLAFLAYNEGIYGAKIDHATADKYLDLANVEVIHQYYELSKS